LAVGVRFAIELVIRPDDLFTIREPGRRMTARASLAALGLALGWARLSPAPPARAERLIVSVRTTGSAVTPTIPARSSAVRLVEKMPPHGHRTSYDLV